MKKFLFVLCFSFLFISYVFAQTTYDSSVEEIIVKINDANVANKNNKRVKEIVKDYTYRVGDDESKNTARKKALEQLKLIILDETGVYIEHYLEIKQSNNSETQLIRDEIKKYTAGSIKLTVIEEKYDGSNYYIKAKALVDPDSVSEGISESLKARANKKEIQNLKTLLASKEKEVDMRSKETIELQKELAKQEIINSSKEKEISKLKKELSDVKRKIEDQKQEEKNMKSEIEIIKSKVKKSRERIEATSYKACYIKDGMTEDEVIDAIGKPDKRGEVYNSIYLVYGTIWLYFNKDNKRFKSKYDEYNVCSKYK